MAAMIVLYWKNNEIYFTDLLQFRFKKKASTVVCTSLSKETIE